MKEGYTSCLNMKVILLVRDYVLRIPLALKTILNIFILLIVGIVTVMLLLYLYQSKLIYPAPETQFNIPLPENILKIDLDLSHSYLLMPKLGSKKVTPLMIFTHGNAELASHWLNDFKPLLENNIAVLFIEYPG